MHHRGHFASALADDEPAILRAVLDHLPMGISLVDRDLRVLAVNRLLIEILNFPLSRFETRLPTLEARVRDQPVPARPGRADAKRRHRHIPRQEGGQGRLPFLRRGVVAPTLTRLGVDSLERRIHRRRFKPQG